MNQGNRMRRWKKVWQEAEVIDRIGDESDEVWFEWRKNYKYPEYYEDIIVRYENGEKDMATGEEPEYINSVWNRLKNEE